MTKKEITIICVAYKRYKTIHVLINSILCQTLDNWKLLVIHDGPDEKMKSILERYADENENIEFMFTETRYNDYGHTLRDMGIQMADTEFLMLTNDDNYYMPVFLEYMFNSIRANNLDFVLCDMIHSHNNPGVYIQQPYNLFKSFPKLNYIDIGNFIVKTSIAKDVGFKDRSFGADGIFVEQIRMRYGERLRIGKVTNILFVHN
jgi:glycosyltransferase involved in cell wall biosynthesis